MVWRFWRSFVVFECLADAGWPCHQATGHSCLRRLNVARQHPLPRILPQDPSRTSSSLDVFKLVLRNTCDVLKPGRLGVPSRARIQAPQLRQDATKLCPNSGACRHMRTNMAKPGASSLHWLAAMRVSSKLNPGGESQPGERGVRPREAGRRHPKLDSSFGLDGPASDFPRRCVFLGLHPG